jgi:hypothetical protein
MVDAETKNALPLAGDGDEVDLVQAVERAFAIDFSNADLEKCLTVGDLHQLILAATPHAERGDSACLSALAFYRLRSALITQFPAVSIRPSTSILMFTGRFGAARFHRRLNHAVNLDLPRPSIRLLCLLLALTTIAAPFAGYHGWGWSGTLLATPLAGLTYLAGSFFSRYDLATIGDLARTVGAMNARRLLPEGATMRTSEVWSVFDAVIRAETGWNGRITAETRLIG